MTSSDPRFSPQAWLRFEGVIAKWLEVYPSAYVFAPSNLALETTIARLRDAVKAKLQYGYPSSLVDHTILSNAWPNVVVTRDRNIPDHVRIGQPLGKITNLITAQTSAIQRDGITIVDPTFEVLTAFCFLVNGGNLPYEIHVKNCNTTVKEWFHNTLIPKYPNIAHMDTDTDSFTII